MRDVHTTILGWYAAHARSLPWRDDPSPWRVLVSEFMLQQTPVARVLPVFEAWLERWPTPEALAAESSGEAIRAWGRLGYPRRALRLHAAAQTIVTDHDGQVPSAYDELLTLPGIGDYTAAAIASFAFGDRRVVLDTNVRRVFARLEMGIAGVAGAPSAAERELAERLLPDDARLAPGWAVATMELGALVCTARSPSCRICPVRANCAWLAAGRPEPLVSPRGPAWAGTDRQVRGRIMAVLRDTDAAVPRAAIDAVWPDADQRNRCLETLLADGLVSRVGEKYSLPN